jgi:hypothetical protein
MQEKTWKKLVLKFLLFVIVGFAAAFIYRQMKNS